MLAPQPVKPSLPAAGRIEKPPAAVLAAAMLAHEPVKPSLQAAGQIEIRPVDGKHERLLQHPGVEPVWQDQFQPKWPAMLICHLLPFVDPGEAMPSALGRLTDRGQDGRRLQPIERGFEPVVIARAGATADK